MEINISEQVTALNYHGYSRPHRHRKPHPAAPPPQAAKEPPPKPGEEETR